MTEHAPTHGHRPHHEFIPSTEEELPILVGVPATFIDNQSAYMQERLHLPAYKEGHNYGLVDTTVAGAAARLTNEAMKAAVTDAPWLLPGVPLVTLKRDLDRVRTNEQRDREGRIHRGLLLPYFRDRATVPAPNLFKYWGKAIDMVKHSFKSKDQRWYQKAEAAAKAIAIGVGSTVLTPVAYAGWLTKKVTSGWIVEAATNPNYSRETRMYFNTIRRLEHTTDMREKQLKKKHGVNNLALSNTIIHLAGGSNDQGKIAEAAAKVADSAVKGFYLAHGDKSGFSGHGEYYKIQELAANTAVANLNLLGNQIRTMREELPGLREQLRLRGGTMPPTERADLQNKINDFETKLTTYPEAHARTKEIIDHTVPSVGERNARLAVILPAHFVGSIASAALGYWATGIIHRMLVNPNDRGRELQDMVNNRVRAMQNLPSTNQTPPTPPDSTPPIQPHHGDSPPSTGQNHDDMLHADAPPPGSHDVENQILPDPRLLEYKYLRPEDIPPVTDINGNRLPMRIPLRSISRPLTHDPRGDVFSHLTKYPQVQTLYMKDDNGVELAVPGNQAAIIIDDVTPEASRRLPTLFGTHDPNQVHVFTTSKGLKVVDEHSGTFRADLLTPQGLIKKVRVPRLMDGFRFRFEGGGWNPDGSYQEGGDLYPTMTVDETRQRVQEFKGYKFFDPVLREWRVVTDVKFNLYDEVYEPGKVVFDPNNPTDPDNYWQQYGNMNEPDTVAYTFCGWQRQGQVGVPDSMRYSANRYVVITRAVSNQTAAVPDTSIVRTSTTGGNMLYGQFPNKKRPGEEDGLAA